MGFFIDRSNNNGADSYGHVTYLYLKATQGTSFIDTSYSSRRASARASGVRHVGAYHFAGGSNPVAEAKFFLARIGKPRSGLRPCLDLESGQSVRWAEEFVNHVRSVLGYYPVLYGNTSTIGAMRRASRTLRKCPWWRAEYGPNDGHRHPLAGGNMGASAHQFTSVGDVPGIAGHTDVSVMLNAKAMLVPSREKVTVRTGSGTTYTYKQGHLYRTRAARRVLSLLRSGHDNLTVKVSDQ